MASFAEIVEFVGLTIDGAGVLVIVLGLLLAAFRFARTFRRKDPGIPEHGPASGTGRAMALAEWQSRSLGPRAA